jgi:hypothetical protein
MNIHTLNLAGDGTAAIPSDYLKAVITRVA